MLKLSSVAAALAFCVLGTVACGPSYPNCNEDEDCHHGEFCVNGHCQLCRTSADCPSGRECQAGRCEDIPGWCQDNTACPNGQRCEDHHCITPVTSDQDLGTTPPDDGSGGCRLQPVYFPFDSENLESDTRQQIDANAQCLRARHAEHVHLTGHTDPRGTEEYNLALGDRRARAVGSYLQSLGMEAGGVTTSSMGEEMSSGEDEDGWRNDRRVEFSTQ